MLVVQCRWEVEYVDASMSVCLTFLPTDYNVIEQHSASIFIKQPKIVPAKLRGLTEVLLE